MTKIKKFRPTHMNGMCVDVTLTDKEGNEIEMPSPFDTMDEMAQSVIENAVKKSRDAVIDDMTVATIRLIRN